MPRHPCQTSAVARVGAGAAPRDRGTKVGQVLLWNEGGSSSATGQGSTDSPANPSGAEEPAVLEEDYGATAMAPSPPATPPRPAAGWYSPGPSFSGVASSGSDVSPGLIDAWGRAAERYEAAQKLAQDHDRALIDAQQEADEDLRRIQDQWEDEARTFLDIAGTPPEPPTKRAATAARQAQRLCSSAEQAFHNEFMALEECTTVLQRVVDSVE